MGELRNLSTKGGGSKTPGYYRGKDGKLYDKNDSSVVYNWILTRKKCTKNGLNWAINKPKTQEELDIIVELQSQGYSPKKEELEESRRFLEDNI